MNDLFFIETSAFEESHIGSVEYSKIKIPTGPTNFWKTSAVADLSWRFCGFFQFPHTIFAQVFKRIFVRDYFWHFYSTFLERSSKAFENLVIIILKSTLSEKC